MNARRILTLNGAVLVGSIFVYAVHYKGLLFISLFSYAVYHLCILQLSKLFAKTFPERDIIGFIMSIKMKKIQIQKVDDKLKQLVRVKIMALYLMSATELACITLNLLDQLSSPTLPNLFQTHHIHIFRFS